jgi:hypothetical protein
MYNIIYDPNYGGRFIFSNATSAAWRWINCGVSSTIGTVPNSGYTIDAWVRTLGLIKNQVYNGLWTITYGIRLYINANGYLESVIDNCVMSSIIYYTAPSPYLYDNKWHHICTTNDRKIHRIYIDGIMVNEVITSNAPTAGYFGTTRWPTSWTALGVDINNNNLCFNGSISCAKIYKRALEPIEVYQNYNAHKLRFRL